MLWKKGRQWRYLKRAIVFRVTGKEGMFPILFYIDVTQARKEEVVIVRREIAEGLDRWMAMKKTDLESDYGRSNRKIQDTVNTLYCPMQMKKGRAGSLSLLSEILLNFRLMVRWQRQESAMALEDKETYLGILWLLKEMKLEITWSSHWFTMACFRKWPTRGNRQV